MAQNPKWLYEYSITHIKYHHLFLNGSLGDPCAISAYGDAVDRALQLAGINLQPEGPDDPLGEGNILAGQGNRFSEERSLERLVPGHQPEWVLPALVHDGRTILDSSVINEYLEDVFPERSLWPRDAVEVAHMRAWRQFIDEVPTVAIRYPSFNAAFVHIWSDMSAMKCVTYAKGCR